MRQRILWWHGPCIMPSALPYLRPNYQHQHHYDSDLQRASGSNPVLRRCVGKRFLHGRRRYQPGAQNGVPSEVRHVHSNHYNVHDCHVQRRARSSRVRNPKGTLLRGGCAGELQGPLRQLCGYNPNHHHHDPRASKLLRRCGSKRVPCLWRKHVQ